jgi:hypothetical protein
VKVLIVTQRSTEEPEVKIQAFQTAPTWLLLTHFAPSELKIREFMYPGFARGLFILLFQSICLSDYGVVISVNREIYAH